MVTIRLQRTGAARRPFYHVVACDSRSRRDGRFIERLGFFNPIAVGGEVPLRIDEEGVRRWVERGATTSPAVRRLLRRQKKAPPPAEGQPDSPAAEAPAES